MTQAIPTLIFAAILTALFAWSQIDAITARRRLNALRRNCFLTDERGVRRKYRDVSAEVRERAEGN